MRWAFGERQYLWWYISLICKNVGSSLILPCGPCDKRKNVMVEHMSYIMSRSRESAALVLHAQVDNYCFPQLTTGMCLETKTLQPVHLITSLLLLAPLPQTHTPQHTHASCSQTLLDHACQKCWTRAQVLARTHVHRVMRDLNLIVRDVSTGLTNMRTYGRPHVYTPFKACGKFGTKTLTNNCMCKCILVTPWLICMLAT